MEYLRSGDRFAADGKLNEAATEYKNAIQQDPRFGEARFKFAEVMLKNGNMAGAYREFIRAADLMPGNVQAQLSAGVMLVAAGEFEDALTRAEKALALEPRHVDGQVLKANALAGLKKYDAAVTMIEAAIKTDPSRSLSYANLGAVQMVQGHAADAEQSYRRAIEVDPKSVRARTEFATFQWRRGDTKLAESVLKEALSLDRRDVYANRLLAAVYVSSNRADEAEPHLKVIAETMNDASARIALADYYRAVRRIPEALKALDEAESDPDGFAPARARKARILYAGNRKADAHAAVNEALARSPKSAEAMLTKADFFRVERKLDQALELAKAAVAADPTSVGAYTVLGHIQRQRGFIDDAISAFNEVLKLSPGAIDAQLDLSAVQLSVGRSDESLRLTRRALAVQPSNPTARLLEARGLMGSGDVAGAEKLVNELARDHRNAPTVQALMGDLHNQKGDHRAARAAYTKALSLDRLNLEALAGLAALDAREDKGPDARARIEGALAKQPDSVPLLLLAGRTYAALDDHAGAERSINRALEIEPTNLDGYDLLARVYRDRGDVRKAIAELEKLAARSPNAASIHTSIGQMLEAQGQIDDARKRYELALSIDAGMPVAANNLAWLIAEHGGNLDRAMQLAQTAKSKLPESPSVTDTLGWVYYKKGLFQQAVSTLREAVDKEPRATPFQYHLGLAYAKTGESKRARTVLEAALKQDPKAAQAEEARATLKQLAALGS